MSVLFCVWAFFTHAQCTVTSSNGWTATINVTPVDAIPSTTNCPWFYHYEVQFNYSVSFSGSTANRSVSGQVYFTCTGGSGGSPYADLGTFTADASGTVTTGNNSRQYNAVGPAYNYGSNPSCTTIGVSDIGCSSYDLNFWGNGVTSATTNCATTSSPLPIELSHFTAHRVDNRVEFEWVTETEKNNDYFSIERSISGEEWNSVHAEPGAGNSNDLKRYNHVDYEAPAKDHYYRLKQTDFDGTFSYSPIVFVGSEMEDLRLYPVPAQTSLTLNHQLPIESVQIFNVRGEEMPVNFFGNGAHRLDTSDLPAGAYFLIVNTGSQEPVRGFFTVVH